MNKRVIVLSLLILLVIGIYSPFYIFASNGSYYYLPNESISAYNFFTGFGLKYRDEVDFIYKDTYFSRAHNVTENGYTITPNYRKLFLSNYTAPSSSVAQYVYFLDENNYQIQPVENVSSHTYSVPSYAIDGNNYSKELLSFHQLKGDFINASGYDTSKRFMIRGNSTVYLSFMSSSPFSVLLTGWTSTNNQSDVTVKSVINTESFGDIRYTKYTYSFTNNTSSYLYFTPYFPFRSLTDISIIPIFLGDSKELTDNYSQYMGIDTETESQLKIVNTHLTVIENKLDTLHSDNVTTHGKLDTLHSDNVTTHNKLDSVIKNLTTGNSATENQVSRNDTATSNFNSKGNQLHSIESSNNTSLSNNLDRIGTDNLLFSDNGFLDSVWFVRTVFNNLINFDSSNSIRLSIIFALILGLALTIIGKLRN